MQKSDYPGVRSDVIQSLDDYVNRGWQPGGFITAVLENNLMEALGRADFYNRESIFEICSYVYNELPLNSWGSREKVSAWLKSFRKENSNV